MKLQISIFEYVALLVCVLGLIFPIVYLVAGGQASQWLVQLMEGILLIIGSGAPICVFLAFQNISGEQDRKVFRNLFLKWFGLLAFVMLLTVTEKAWIGL